MAELGSLSLLTALVLAIYVVVGSVLGERRGIPALVKSARYGLFILPLVLAVSTASLIAAFVKRDFQVEYVFEHSSLAMDRSYAWVALYAGNEGSLLFIALALSVLAALAVALAPRRLEGGISYTSAALGLTLLFFLAVMVTLADPFAKLPFTPEDGRGINPLLAHPGMFIHPPALMTGLISVSIPFSFAMGALVAGKRRDEWLEVGRTWSLVSWVILGLGLMLGAWWAYTILGWGGYWAWDPVENAGLLPWLPLTAFLHSIMVQKRRGMFRMWNIVLIIIAFGMALYGMFMNRGGPVPSVHSFAQSTLGWVFLFFLAFTMVAALVVLLWRSSALKSDQPLESPLSREGAFLANNLLFLAATFVVLWGVVYPLISEAFRGVTITVGRPFYDQIIGPLFLALIFLMALGPLLPWRRASLENLRSALLVPGLVALGVLALLLLLGVRKPYAVVSFTLVALVAAGILREWVRGALSRHRLGESYPLGFVRLIASNRPRYGGYIVHLSIVLIALAATGSSFYDTQRDVTLAPGGRASIGPYTAEYVNMDVAERPDRIKYTALVRVFKNGDFVGNLTPSLAIYRDFNIAATRAGIRSTPVEDLYLVPQDFFEDGRVALRMRINPLVMWLWLAGPVLLLGTVVTLWPERPRVTVPAARLEEAPVPQPSQW